jgi:DNA-binding IclR family transcriptional regulator
MTAQKKVNPSSQIQGAQTIQRAIRLLKLVASQSERGIRLVDVAEKMELERPTAHRLLKALMAEGMLTQHAGTRCYQLGSTLFELGLAAAHQINLHDICMPVLRKLAELSGDTSFLFVRSGNDSVCIARVQGTYPIQTPAVPVGGRQPLGVNAGGLALLASLPAAEVAAIIDDIAPRLDAYGHLDETQLHEHWCRAVKAGYALIGNRAVPGVTAIGLPILNKTGLPIAAITVAAITSRMGQERINEILPLLRDGEREMARLLYL